MSTDKQLLFYRLQEEYEDEVDEDVKPSVNTKFEHALEEEDPEVIKELITLIKKVGGLDELEKQLQVRLNLTQRIAVDAKTTVSPISQSLYNKVIGTKRGTTQQNEPLIQRQNKEQRYSTLFRNSRPAPQNDGVQTLPEIDENGDVIRERPQYTTITRAQSPKSTEEDDVEDGEETGSDDDETDEDNAPAKNKNTQDGGHIKTPTYQYVNIQRTRSSTAAPQSENDDDDEDDGPTESNVNPITAATPPRMQYVNIQRIRPTKPQYYAEYFDSSSSPSPSSTSTSAPESK